jgi:hypothetical protein
MRLKPSIAFSLMFLVSFVSGQSQTDSSWSFSLSGFYYYVPEDKNLLSFIGYADHKRFHLEARYNYEDRNTGSVFGGWRFETGNSFEFAATPMVGVIFGNLDGIAPGLELEATYGKFGYYSETEYVIDFSGDENNFVYVWGELVFKPIPALDIGVTYQKTRLYQTDVDIQWGILSKYSFGRFTAGAYYFNPFTSDDFIVFSLSLDF